MRWWNRLSALAASAAATASGESPPAPLLAENFDTPASARWMARLHAPQATLAAGRGVGGSGALPITYAGDGHGSARVVRSYPLPSPVSEATLNYDVRFDSDFQFVRGGKLHRLAPHRIVAGGEPIRPDGWSARVMWREDDRVETYTHHQVQKEQYGETGSQVGPLRFAGDRWYAVALHVRVNRPATAANSFVRLFVDGRLVVTHEGCGCAPWTAGTA